MDYEKKYKEALDRARIWKEKSGMPKNKQGILDDIFPELAEPDDREIRKALLNYMTKMWENSLDDVCGVHVGDVIAWLEKQSEQKPFDYENANIQQRDWAEIPFGAKDSELQEATYLIPEGFHAEIKGNEVFIKKEELKSSWTKEDDVRLQACIDALQAESLMGKVDTVMTKWLESLKQRIGGKL